MAESEVSFRSLKVCDTSNKEGKKEYVLLYEMKWSAYLYSFR